MKKKRKKKVLEILTLKDAVNILAFYDVEHCRFPHNYIADLFACPTLNELVVDDKKLILIDKELGVEKTREVILHALIHIKHYLAGDLPDNYKIVEESVQAETAMTYKEMYGVEPPIPD